eukprot:TRINITY_DN33705_c0_g1_i1.p1 TRINITY_DN33705_c0_g1~~TRINITY_DN33705_c0_g1_i1.p1  ORF type:complete len:263 (-),score=41.68 TRINITY_DN33705_c0_g1_i1:141-869(-)
MGCGASANNNDVQQTTTKFLNPEEKERQDRRMEIVDKHKATEKDKSKIITYPVFKIPQIHATPGSPHMPEFVFFGVKDETCTEVTLFFEDKDNEFEIIERQGITFYLNKDEERKAYTSVSFDHSWGGEERWDSPPSDAMHAHTEPYAAFQIEERSVPDDASTLLRRPVVYINTASHLFGSRNTNPDLTLYTFDSYIPYAGNHRQATDILLRASEAANPDKKEVSALAALIPVRTATKGPKKK